MRGKGSILTVFGLFFGGESLIPSAVYLFSKVRLPFSKNGRREQ